MDFAFTDDQEHLRAGVRLVLDTECTPDALRAFELADEEGRVAQSQNRGVAATGIQQISGQPGDHPGRAMTALRSALFLIWFVLLTAVMGIIFLPLLALPRKLTVWMARGWAGATLWGLKIFCGLDMAVEGRAPQGGVLVASKLAATSKPRWRSTGETNPKARFSSIVPVDTNTS